ncbi:super-infection exclusion protein B [Limosilactobacillus caviae]|uniref:super-infection exclusion protein B n=1 Tax=Limosilactobacillus caviae TaxID=1769424 RepID=UPI003517152A
MEYVKAVLEAFNLRMKHRVIGFLSGVLILFLRPIAKFYNMEWFYNKISWIVVLITAFFGVILVVDLGEYIIKKVKNKFDNKKYKEYILNLSDEKLDIVKRLYQNPPQYKEYLHENDPNVLELFSNHVITRLKGYTIGRESKLGDLNDPPMLYVLQPRALEIIKANNEKFR